MLGKNRKKDWELEGALKEVERILKEARLDTKWQGFVQTFNQEQEQVTPPDEWQSLFNSFFENLIDEFPALACCILAFKAGAVWQSKIEK